MDDFEIFLKEHPDSESDYWNKLKGYKSQNSHLNSKYFFEPDFFGLNKTTVWKELDSHSQNKIIFELSQNIISEALQIEMAGMFYASKMSLLSKTLDERQMFCEFASQESRHFQSLKPYLSCKNRIQHTSDFSRFVANIVQKSDYINGLLLIQTALEGWGLNYYRELMLGTNSMSLSSIFKEILKDEVKHHTSGVHLLDGLLGTEHFNNSDVSVQVLHQMLDSIRIGPANLCLGLMKYNSLGSKKNINTLLLELNAVESSVDKMYKFKSILEKVIEPKILNDWNQDGKFEVFNSNEMAEYIFSASNKLKNPLPELDLTTNYNL